MVIESLPQHTRRVTSEDHSSEVTLFLCSNSIAKTLIQINAKKVQKAVDYLVLKY